MERQFTHLHSYLHVSNIDMPKPRLRVHPCNRIMRSASLRMKISIKIVHILTRNLWRWKIIFSFAVLLWASIITFQVTFRNVYECMELASSVCLFQKWDFNVKQRCFVQIIMVTKKKKILLLDLEWPIWITLFIHKPGKVFKCLKTEQWNDLLSSPQ